MFSLGSCSNFFFLFTLGLYLLDFPFSIFTISGLLSVTLLLHSLHNSLNVNFSFFDACVILFVNSSINSFEYDSDFMKIVGCSSG